MAGGYTVYNNLHLKIHVYWIYGNKIINSYRIFDFTVQYVLSACTRFFISVSSSAGIIRVRVYFSGSPTSVSTEYQVVDIFLTRQQ